MPPFTSGYQIEFWIVALGILSNVSCALLGCYLVLRRMSLLGDAISHAVLPGLVVAFLFTGSRASLPMFAGAMAVGILTAFLSQTVHRVARVSEDTGMGVVFTSLFALGVILIQIPGVRQVDLDPSCVLMGQIEFEVLDKVDFLGLWIPFAVKPLAGMLLLNLLFILVFWKVLKLASFDPALSTSLGFNAALVFYLLMALVAGTTVVAFWVVGSILVIAMLIVPAATAHLLVGRLSSMMIVAAAVAVFSSYFGYQLADRWNTSTAGMMAVVAGAQYALAVAFSPRHGLLFRWLRNAMTALRICREDILAALYRWEEKGRGREPLPVSEARKFTGVGWGFLLGLFLLSRRQHIRREAAGLRLTEAGRELAAKLIRSHRLWESFLSREVGLPADHVHDPAMYMEHYVTPAIETAIAHRLGDQATDPHGNPIPTPPRAKS